MVEEKYTPEEIEAWKQPIKGEDGITRFDARTKPHYWIYEKGVEVWNRWANNELDEQTYNSIFNNIETYCGKDKALELILDGVNCLIDFEHVLFGQEVNFAKAIFNSPVSFNYSSFEGSVNFCGAIFKKHTSLWNTIFWSNSLFMGTNFEKEIQFIKVVFANSVDFRGANFSSYATFRSAIFNKNAYFINGIKFFERADFAHTIFYDDANFGESIFLRGVDFIGATFIKRVPNFIGADIKGDIDFSANETCFPNYNPNNYIFIRTTERVATQYSLLRSLMKKMEFPAKELFFHGKELEAKSYDKNEPKHLRFLYKKYGEFSDYGQSVWQPIKFWLGIIVMFFCFYLIHSRFFEMGSLPHSLYSAMHYSIPFLPSDMAVHNLSFGLNDICSVKTEQGKIESKNTLCIASFNVIRFFHSIFALLFIFLIGLGLRNNLRMR